MLSTHPQLHVCDLGNAELLLAFHVIYPEEHCVSSAIFLGWVAKLPLLPSLSARVPYSPVMPRPYRLFLYLPPAHQEEVGRLGNTHAASQAHSKQRRSRSKTPRRFAVRC